MVHDSTVLGVSYFIYYIQTLSPKLAHTWILLGISHLQMNFYIHFLRNHLKVIIIRTCSKKILLPSISELLHLARFLFPKVCSGDLCLSTYKKEQSLYLVHYVHHSLYQLNLAGKLKTPSSPHIYIIQTK